MHALVARNGIDQWGAWVQEASGLAWSPASAGRRLELVTDDALDLAFKTKPPMNFTFSEREFVAVSSDIAETPADLASVDLNVGTEILLAEGRFPEDDRWAVVRRDARTGATYSFGTRDTFRGHTLKARIRQWFAEEQGWPSFGPPNRNRPETLPPPWSRELYVRHGEGWRARKICPGDFPTFRSGFPHPTPSLMRAKAETA